MKFAMGTVPLIAGPMTKYASTVSSTTAKTSEMLVRRTNGVKRKAAKACIFFAPVECTGPGER